MQLLPLPVVVRRLLVVVAAVTRAPRAVARFALALPRMILAIDLTASRGDGRDE